MQKRFVLLFFLIAGAMGFNTIRLQPETEKQLNAIEEQWIERPETTTFPTNVDLIERGVHIEHKLATL